jgi:regulator of RNase E activity RraB
MRELFSRIEDGEVVNIEAEVDLEDEKELYPWLFSVFVKFGNLDEESENFENFLETKESLIIALEYDSMAKYIGSRLKDEWNEFYFYARSAKNLEVIVTKMLRDSGYKYESSVVKDAKWDFYHKYIYPTELELYNIESDKIIFLLEEEGDELSTPRDVEHYVSFETATQKERFVHSVLSCGFEFKDDISSEEFEHGVALVKRHNVKNEEVRAIVEELYELIKKEHGYYEGWSTVLVDNQG